MLTQLDVHKVEKPWGRNDLKPPFANAEAADQPRIGEYWYQQNAGAADAPLLIKYLFTSEKLSVQVHPNDKMAEARGYKCGKTECWYVVDATPDAVLGLGLKQETNADTLRAASLSGAVEEMIDWKPTKAGDIWYVEAGTVHAIGPGLTLIEVQQNIDLTYRLYDYGRPRELHLDDGIAVSTPGPYAMTNYSHFDGEAVVHQWPHFGMALCSDAEQAKAICAENRKPHYCVPVKGNSSVSGKALNVGHVYHMKESDTGDGIAMDRESVLLIAWPNKKV
ncbi:MAG: class I mannose-6-phosphate isomerase [Pseudomonadota bacterium]